jgi:hypothetical protein
MSRAPRLVVPLLAAGLVAVGLSWAGPVAEASAAPSTAQAAAVAPESGRFTPVATARIFSGTVGTSPVAVAVAGHGGIPSTATAVVVNIEVEAPTAAGYVRATPAGIDASVATQEFTKGETISNLATVKLNGGKIQTKLSAGSAKVFLDVSGYYSNTGGLSTYSPVTNFRIYSHAVGTTPTQIKVAGVGSVPSDATAVAINTEVEKPSVTGYVRVTPAGQDASVAAQEYLKGGTISNLVIAKLGTGGAVQVKLSAGSGMVFMDVAGYYSPSSTGSVFVPINTTRASIATVTTSPKQIALAGTAGVPATATGVVVNTEIESPTSAGYVRITPGGTDATVAAQVFNRGQTISNLVISKLANKSVQAKVSAGSATQFLDVSGYFLDGSSGTGIGNDISTPQCGAAYPVGQPFGIVGVNDTNAIGTNPCLASELAWAQASVGGTAQPKAALYVLTANPGLAASGGWPITADDPQAFENMSTPYGSCDPQQKTGPDFEACSYIYGYARAYDDVNSRGVTTPTAYRWWLDVETTFTYSTDKVANVADLEGMTAYFKSANISVGIYSNSSQWSAIAGSVLATSPLSTLPNWIPLGPSTLAAAQTACSGAPLMRGTITMTQYVSGDLDYDNSCS